MGTGAFTLLSVVMSDEAFLAWGWRLAFFVSIILVIVGVYLRSKIAETPSFRTAQKELGHLRRQIPLKQLLKDRISRRHLLLGMGTRYAEGVAYNLWAVFVIAYATGTVGFERLEVLLAIMVAAVVLAFGIPLSGRLSDALPRRVVFSAGAVLLALLIFPAFGVIQTGSWWMLTGVLVVMLGLAYPLMYGSQAAFYAELFPPSTRYSGISIVYQLSGIVASGLTPMILTWLIGGPGLAVALGYVVFTCVVTLICVWLIRAKDISAVSVEEGDVIVR